MKLAAKNSLTFVKGQWHSINVRKHHYEAIKKMAKKLGYGKSELLGLAITEFLDNLKIVPNGSRPKKR